jgi:hypothetical protein
LFFAFIHTNEIHINALYQILGISKKQDMTPKESYSSILNKESSNPELKVTSERASFINSSPS